MIARLPILINGTTLLLILATLGWAGNTVAARLAVGEISPMMLIMIRWLMVSVLVLALYGKSVLSAYAELRDRKLWILRMGAGLCGFNILFYWAAHYTTATKLGLIQGTLPALILLGGLVVYKTRVGLGAVVGLIIAFTGGAVVISGGSLGDLLSLMFNKGDLIMMTACFFYASYALGLQNRPPISGVAIMGLFSVAAFLVSVPFAVGEAVVGAAQMPGFKGWILLIYIVLFPSFLSQVFFIKGVDMIGAGKAGMYTYLIPVFSGFLAVLILRENLELYHFIALVLVSSGIYIAERGKREVK